MTPEFIVNHLWQSSCFALVAAALAFMLRGNSPKVRYWIWLSASLKFLVPWTLLVSLGNAIPWRATSAAPPPLPNTLVQLAQPLPPEYFSAVPTHADTHWGITALALLWALGFVVLVFIRWKSWNSVRAMLRAGTPVDLPIPVRALITPAATEPGVVGFLKPVLVLPELLLERLNPEQIEALLAHEMCHVRRRDNLFAALHMGIETIFWFHPILWWIRSRMLKERELACDEEVLRLGHEPTDYVRGILTVCQHYSESRLPCVAGVTGADIKARVRTILRGNLARELSRYKKLALAFSALAAVAVPIGLGVWNAPLARAQSAPAKFEVASIRPANGPIQGGGPICGRSLDANAIVSDKESVLASSGGTLVALINHAYQDSMDGMDLPQWIKSDQRFAVSVKIPPNTHAGACRAMLRNLLAERFHLVTDFETRELTHFYLKVAKSGPKLKPADPPAPDVRPATMSTPVPGEVRFTFRSATISDIIPSISVNLILEAQVNGLVNDPSYRLVSGGGVIDDTGLTGYYDGSYDFYATRPPDEAAESLKDILTRQLGLTLEPRRAPGKVLIIRSGERMPTEN